MYKFRTLFDNGVPSLVMEHEYDPIYLTNPEAIYEFCINVLFMDRETEEYVYLFCFDDKLNLKGFFEVSHGNANTSLLGAREVFMKALVVGATRIVLVHNHPTGDCTPSKEDVSVTKKIADAGKLLGVPLMDHIIIGNGYYSFKESEVLL